MNSPKIRAEFQLDEKGKPLAIDRNNLKHYKIRLYMVDVPEDAYAVVYRLDETYYDPTREVRRGAPDFEERITSYGDYVVKAEIRGKKSSDLSAVELSQALRDTYVSSSDEGIRRAILDIEEK